MEYILVKAAPDMRCKNPKDGTLLTESPKRVVKNAYWLRRLNDGECLLVEDNKPALPKDDAPVTEMQESEEDKSEKSEQDNYTPKKKSKKRAK